MTEEIIRAIIEAEETAAEEKKAASLTAAALLEEAEQAVKVLEKSALEECKACEEKEKKAAETLAQKQYEDTLSAQRQSAENYCAEILLNVDTAVSKIVGRVTRGDC